MPDHAPNPSSVDVERVEISVPLRTEYFATLRTLAASLGADAGFTVDEIDDLRLAISEVVSCLGDGPDRDDTAAGSGEDRIDATFEVGGEQIGVSITTRHATGELVLDDLATGILDSVVDDYEVRGAAVRLVKRAAEARSST
jgi:serine/threonine-protein kinase RsbW